MTSRTLLTLIFCSFTIAAGCASLDEAQPASDESSATADTIELQSFAQQSGEKPKCNGRKPKNFGQPCGCGNTFQCNGICGGGDPIPASYGQPCGCGNTFQCNGICGGGDPIPANFGQPCGCGNTFQCNGICGGGDPIPANFGESCGCGNTFQCNGICDGGSPRPANYDLPCGGCGGKTLCDGSCSIPCPT